jgi:dihydrofolate reductase
MMRRKFKSLGETPMGKVVYDVSMSLDGFISGANVRPEAGLGDGGEKLHEWAFNSVDPRNQKIVEGSANTGATITGRITYDLSIPYWGADGPAGAVRMPTIIVSHSVPKDVPPNSVYTFVNSIEAAFEKAQELAGEKEISIAGSNVARQFLQLGFIDELWFHVVPVVFGSGTPLFGDMDSKHISLETIEVIETKEVIHTRFRVVK